MRAKRPWKYLSTDMNWRGVLVALCLLALLMIDFAILGNATAGYVGAAVIVLVSAVGLRTTAHRRG
jgi:hypothetical protein